MATRLIFEPGGMHGKLQAAAAATEHFDVQRLFGGIDRISWRFPPDDVSKIICEGIVPEPFDTSTVEVVVYYWGEGATGDWVLLTGLQAFSDGDSGIFSGFAGDTVQNTITVATADLNELKVQVQDHTSAQDSMAVGDLLTIELGRLGGAAGDTLTGDIKILRVELRDDA